MSLKVEDFGDSFWDDFWERRKRRREAARKRAQKQEISFYLDRFIIPYLEDTAGGYGETLEDGVRRLIRKKSYKYPLRYKKDEAAMRMQRWLSNPAVRVILARAKPIIRSRLNQINDGLDFMLDEVISERYPYLYDTITGEEGGREWFKTTVQDMIKLLRHLMRV